MRKFYIFLITVFITITSFGQTEPWFSEINYLGGLGFFEISGLDGTNLANYKVTVYNKQGTLSQSIPLSGFIPTAGSSFGAVSFPITVSSPEQKFIVFEKVSPSVILNLITIGDRTKLSGSITHNGINYGLAIFTDAGIDNATASSSLQYTTDSGWTGTPIVPSTPGVLNAGETLSVVKNEIENFTMYPNPVANGKLYMSSGINLTKEVAIYALTGQQVYRKNLQNKEPMDIANLNKGIYLVKIKEEGKIATRKLVVN